MLKELLKVQKLNNFLLFLFVSFTFLCSSLNSVYAHEFTDYSYFIKIDTTEFNEIVLYVPSDQVEFLQITEENKIVNVSSNDVVLYSNDTKNTFILSTFDSIRYSEDGSLFSYLTVNSILDTNINNSLNFVSNNFDVLLVGIVFIGGFLLWLVLLKH